MPSGVLSVCIHFSDETMLALMYNLTICTYFYINITLKHFTVNAKVDK